MAIVYFVMKKIMSVIIKHIPNTITCLNLLCGCVAVVAALEGFAIMAFALVLLAAVFDFMDGMAARLLKAYSPMGKELDSLADLVSFGLVPAMLVFDVLRDADLGGMYAYLAFLIAVFSALRLAKFNVDERQTSSFIGLPTPANALFWGGLLTAYHQQMVNVPCAVLVLVGVMSILLVCELPLFSLKFKSMKWGDNKLRFVFLMGCLALIVGLVLTSSTTWFLGLFASFVWIVVWYVGLSLGVWIAAKIKA